MTTEMFSVWDAAAMRYMDPFPAPTLEFALRGFREACTTPDHQFNKYPEDYVLYHVGTFFGETGHFEELEPRKIAMANSFAREQTNSTQFLTDDDVDGLYEGRPIGREQTDG